jgi:MPBQ/MSBQ methyltransferase
VPPVTAPAKTNRALKFYEEVLGFGYLHYGVWDGEPLTLEGLKAAQERYADLLCSLIPPGVKSVLDAGCGTGGNALKLKARGYEVEGLSPDPYQQRKFTERTGLPFHLARFQDFAPPRRYDLVFMSESCQYVPLPELFPAIARAAAPGGHAVVSDYFPLEKDGSRMTKSGHALDAFLDEAQKHRFELLEDRDITDRVAPTLDLAREWVERYAIPAAQLAAETLQEKRPWLFRIGRFLLRKRIAKLDEQRVLLDSAEFRRKKRYRVFLLRAPAPP